jgi:hypothetical protein
MKRSVIFILLIAACRSKPASNIQITVDHTHKAIKITGTSATVLYGIRHDTLTTEAWQALFPVYQMPADTEMRNYQPAIKGKYAINGAIISFMPDTPFRAGQTYFARYYNYDQPLSATDMALRTRKPGQIPFTELIFKY